MQIKDASKDDAVDLAYLINLAGEGIPEYLWKNIAEKGESPWEVGAKRAAREEGGFSYNNARICVAENILQGMILSYQQDNPYHVGNINDFPPIVRPLIELESKAPGSWYINAVATFEQYRSQGVAQALILDAENKAKACGCDAISLIVASENRRAKKLYDFLGFNIADALPVVTFPGCHYAGKWLLMIKEPG